jgi:hypothetical protein
MNLCLLDGPFLAWLDDGVYWGTSNSTTLDEAGIKALASTLAADPAGNYVFTVGASEVYFYQAWPAAATNPPIIVDGFIADGFGVDFAGADAGYDQTDNGWPFKLVTVDTVPCRLYRTLYKQGGTLTIGVTTA